MDDSSSMNTLLLTSPLAPPPSPSPSPSPISEGAHNDTRIYMPKHLEERRGRTPMSSVYKQIYYNSVYSRIDTQSVFLYIYILMNIGYLISDNLQCKYIQTVLICNLVFTTIMYMIAITFREKATDLQFGASCFEIVPMCCFYQTICSMVWIFITVYSGENIIIGADICNENDIKVYHLSLIFTIGLVIIPMTCIYYIGWIRSWRKFR